MTLDQDALKGNRHFTTHANTNALDEPFNTDRRTQHYIRNHCEGVNIVLTTGQHMHN